jgi:chromosome segregation ATPase
MNIVEQFGRKPKVEPTMPTAPRPNLPSLTVPHEEAAKALAWVTKLNNEVQALHTENAQLRNDLHLALTRCDDADRTMRMLRADLEQYRRYSVEVRTHLQHIVDAATRANEAALEAGERPEPIDDKQAEKMIAAAERELREVAAEKIGQRFGAGKGDQVTEPQHG